ncbi:MAG: hypothetical protein WCJ07_11380, partial [Verrucomicrobiota bacterium]
VVGNPVIDRTRLMMSYTYNARALTPAPIPPQKIALLEKATLAAIGNITQALRRKKRKAIVAIPNQLAEWAEGMLW